MAFERVRVSRTLPRLLAGLGTAGACLVAIGAAGQQANDRAKFEMLGICSYDASKLDCWNPQGRRDAGLIRNVDRALRSRSDGTFQYRYGMKNRLLVFGQDARYQVTFSSPAGSYYNTIEGRSDDLGPTLKMVPVATDFDRKVGSISVTLQTGELLGTATSPLKGGTEFKLRDSRVLIGVPELRSNQGGMGAPNMPAPPRRNWTYPLEITSPPGTTLELRAAAFDLKGNLIENVDVDGRPIPLPKQDPNEYRGYYGSLLQIGRTGNGRTPVLLTTIDPEVVSEIRWSANLNRLLEFKDFPLDPKR